MKPLIEQFLDLIAPYVIGGGIVLVLLVALLIAWLGGWL